MRGVIPTRSGLKQLGYTTRYRPRTYPTVVNVVLVGELYLDDHRDETGGMAGPGSFA